MPLKVREIIEPIEADGWVPHRTRGGHHHDVHPEKPGVVTVPGKPSRDLSIGTERIILKQAGLTWR